jgi:hypothetical protein
VPAARWQPARAPLCRVASAARLSTQQAGRVAQERAATRAAAPQVELVRAASSWAVERAARPEAHRAKLVRAAPSQAVGRVVRAGQQRAALVRAASPPEVPLAQRHREVAKRQPAVSAVTRDPRSLPPRVRT